MNGENRLLRVSRETLSEVLARAWKEETVLRQDVGDETTQALRRLLRNQHPLIVDEVFHCLKEHYPVRTDGGDFLLIEEPNSSQDTEELAVIPPLAYLRAMLMMIWETFRHPLSTSTIDLATGRVVDRF